MLCVAGLHLPLASGPFCLHVGGLEPSSKKLFTSPLWRFKGQSKSAGHMLGLTKDTFQPRHGDVQPTQSFRSPRASDKSLPSTYPDCSHPRAVSCVGACIHVNRFPGDVPASLQTQGPHVSVLRHRLSFYIAKLKQNRGYVFLLSTKISVSHGTDLI